MSNVPKSPPEEKNPSHRAEPAGGCWQLCSALECSRFSPRMLEIGGQGLAICVERHWEVANFSEPGGAHSVLWLQEWEWQVCQPALPWRRCPTGVQTLEGSIGSFRGSSWSRASGTTLLWGGWQLFLQMEPLTYSYKTWVEVLCCRQSAWNKDSSGILLLDPNLICENMQITHKLFVGSIYVP